MVPDAAVAQACGLCDAPAALSPFRAPAAEPTPLQSPAASSGSERVKWSSGYSPGNLQVMNARQAAPGGCPTLGTCGRVNKHAGTSNNMRGTCARDANPVWMDPDAAGCATDDTQCG